MTFSAKLMLLAVLCCTFIASAQADGYGGGYTDLNQKELESKRVQRALDFAVDQAIERLIRIDVLPKGKDYDYRLITAEQQIVDGINYRFGLKIYAECDNNISAAVSVVVYQAPNGKLRLVSLRPLV